MILKGVVGLESLREEYTIQLEDAEPYYFFQECTIPLWGKVEEKLWQIVLNESMLHKVHPIPEVHETLALLAGTMVFSELDANCGFWQIALAKESGC